MEKVQGHRPISNAIAADLDELDRENAQQDAVDRAPSAASDHASTATSTSGMFSN